MVEQEDDGLYCHEEDSSVITTSDDDDLHTLLKKEEEEAGSGCGCLNEAGRSTKQALEWILRISSHYHFSPLTPILTANFLHRFLLLQTTTTPHKPWIIHLAALASLSLAAKLHETHVPLLLDLQLVEEEGTEYVFSAKTVQRMELLVLSTLKWRMNPVTPLHYIHHIVTRLGLKSYWDFLNSCHNLLLSLLSDPRFMLYLPSVMATATILHLIHPSSNFENHLLSLLKITKDQVTTCYQAISDILSHAHANPIFKKRRIEEVGLRLPSFSTRVFVNL